MLSEENLIWLLLNSTKDWVNALTFTNLNVMLEALKDLL